MYAVSKKMFLMNIHTIIDIGCMQVMLKLRMIWMLIFVAYNMGRLWNHLSNLLIVFVKNITALTVIAILNFFWKCFNLS